MRPSLLLRGFSILSLLFCAAGGFAQNPPPTPVPLITEVTPPSLSPANLPPGNNGLTLIILGANFVPGEAVMLSGPGGSTAIAVNPTINASGTQMVASFANVSLPVPGTLTVTVTKRANTGAILLASNPYYLPVTPSEPTVALEAPVTSFLQGAPKAMATADFNGDGLPDLAVISQGPNGANAVSILTGSFGGVFTAGASYPTGNAPSGIVAADFNGDHVVDLAVTNAMDNTVTIFLGNGDGTFRPGTTISDTGVYPTQIVAADFNGDGQMDLAVLNLCGTGQYGCYPAAVPSGPGNVAILLGNGDGTFTVAPTLPATGLAPTAIAAADLNQDGFIDLIVANANNSLTLLMGNGDGTFSAAQDAPLTAFSGPPTGIAIGDFIGNGKLDVAVTSSGDQTIAVFVNQNCAGLPAAQCSLTLQYAAQVPTGLTAIATADMNADGALDLVVVNSGAGTASVLLGDGTGHFTSNQSFAAANSSPTVALLDVNMDGRLDVVTAESVLRQKSVMQLQLTTNNSSFVYGIVPTLSVQLTPPPGAPAGPTGIVSLLDGSTAVTSLNLSGTQYQIQFVLPAGFFFGAGTHQLTAVYNGDANFAPATSNAVTATVAMSATATTLSSDLTNGPYGVPATLTASIQPQYPAPASGTVTFTDTTNSTTLGTVTVSNNSAQLVLTNLGAGSHTIVASYQGDANCTGSASSSVSVTITQASTTLTLGESPTQTQLGQPVRFTATLPYSGNNYATGTVTFYDGATSLGTVTIANNLAALSVSTLAVGIHNITALYSADANFLGSTATAITETITPATPTVSLVLYEVATYYGQNAGSVSSVQGGGANLPTATGTLTFMDGSAVLGTAALVGGSAQFTLPVMAVGSHSISVRYSGDANYQAGTSASSTENVLIATTTTTVSVSATSAFYGQAVTLTAAIQPQYGGSATGTVYFYDGGQSLGGTTPSSNSAVFVVSDLAAGTHNISAYYMGDKNTYSSGASPVALTVNPSATTTTLTSSPNPTNYGQVITLTFNVKPAYGTLVAGQISFFDGSTLITTVNTAVNSQIGVLLAAGTHSITAQYLGTPNYLASTSAPVTQTVNQTQSTITLNVNPSSSTYGQSVTATASLSSSNGFSGTGTVTFYDGGTSIGSTSVTFPATTASFSLSPLSVGSHSLTAKYSGDSNYLGSTSSALTEIVNQASSTTSVSSSASATTFGQPVTFTATVTPGYGSSLTGTLTFFDGSTSLGTAPVANNTAQLPLSTLAAGAHSITAKYSGDANYLASTSTAITQTVNQAATSTNLASSLNPSTYGQTATLTATVQGPSGVSTTGTVTFLDGTTPLGSATLSGNSAQLTIASLGAGTHSLAASYGGNSNLLASTSTAVSQVVSQASTTTTVSSSANPASAGQPVIFGVSVQPAFGGTASGSVSFSDGGTLLGTVSLTNNSGQLSVSTLGAGSHSITAAYNGDANTAASTSAILSQTINPTATTTTFTASPNPSVFNQWISFVVTVAPATGGTPTGTITLMDGTNNLSTATLASGLGRISYSGLAPGTHPITAVYSGDGNFTASKSAVQNVTVNQASTATTVSSSLNPSTYGLALTITASVQAPQGINPIGTVTFMDGSATLGSSSLSNGLAQFTLSGLGAGSHTLTAVYAGDTYLTGSTSTGLAQSVSAASSATTVSSSVNPATFGQTVVFSATIQPASGGAATGTVTFLDGTVALGSSPVSGNAAQLSLSSLGVGSHAITAKYSGDNNVAGSMSAALTQTVGQAATTTTVTSAANPVGFGQSVTFSVRIQSSASGTPTGTVTLMDGSSSLGSTALPANGVAQFAITSLASGAQAISASYSGDATYAGSTSSVLTETVNPASSTISMAVSPNPAAFGQAVVLAASVTPSISGDQATGAVTFFDGAASLGTANLSNNSTQLSVSNLAAGSHSVTAQYAGDANFIGSTSAAVTETVNEASTTTTLVSNLNPAAFGQAVTLTASVQAGAGISIAGTVTFMDGSLGLGTVTLANNSAQLTTSSLAPGAHTLTAVYNSNGNFATSTSAALTETANQLTTTTTLASSANPAPAGQSVTFTATVQAGAGNSATGTVTFLDGSTTLGTATVSSGSAPFTTSSLAPGSHSITAAFSGSTDFAASTSAVLTETVNPIATTTTLAPSANPALAGQSVTFTATVQAGAGNPATGTVRFLDGSTTLGTATVSNNSAQLTTTALGAGSHAITAAYGGSTDFGGSTSAVLTETVNQASTTTTLVSNLNPATFGQPVPFVATVQTASGGPATGTVTFYDGTTVLGTAAVTNNGGQHNGQLTFAGLLGGTHTITAAYGGDANYTASTSSALTQTINPASSSVTVAASSNPASFGQAVTLTATVVPSVSGTLATGTVTFFDGGISLGSGNLSNNAAQISVGNFALGSHSITATYAGDRNLSASTSPALSEVVNPAPTSTVLTSSASPIVVKNTVTFTATVSSSISGTQAGTVNFYLDGSSTAAASVSLSNGTAKYSNNSLSAGSHSVVAVFSSTNPDFAGSTSSTFTQFVSDFTVDVSPSSLTVVRGTSGTYTLTVAPAGEFSGTVSLTCGGVPGGTTCAISPTQVTLSGSGSSQATVTITAAQNASKGTHTITFTGTSGGLNHKITASLTID